MWLIFVFFFAEFEHKHPAVPPADPVLWQSCCREHDCMEAPISVSKIDPISASVHVSQFPVFRMGVNKIFNSANGRSYFCRIDIDKPPATDNIRCIFVAKPNQV